MMIWFVLLIATSFMTPLVSGQRRCIGGLTCGRNANCQYAYKETICACIEGYSGNPKIECIKNQCAQNSDCSSNEVCVDGQCKDMCTGMCGQGALCNVNPSNNIPVCSCPQGYTGNPLEKCRELGPQEVCEIGTPCGNNTICRVGKERSTAVCSCKKGYKGDPLVGCEPECYSNKDCQDHQECVFPGCKSVCEPSPCGKDTNCKFKNHQAECECYYNRVGDPWVGCSAECKSSSECPYDRPVCFNDMCINPCFKNTGQPSCGEKATCTIKDDVAVCSCPRGFIGDALKKCVPLQASDVCKMVTCGENAICSPKKQNDGHYIALCSCPRLHKGNALRKCLPVECDTSRDCPDKLVCSEWKCQNPCPSKCGSGAKCRVNKDRIIICSCPLGTTGNPLKACIPVNE